MYCLANELWFWSTDDFETGGFSKWCGICRRQLDGGLSARLLAPSGLPRCCKQLRDSLESQGNLLWTWWYSKPKSLITQKSVTYAKNKKQQLVKKRICSVYIFYSINRCIARTAVFKNLNLLPEVKYCT